MHSTLHAVCERSVRDRDGGWTGISLWRRGMYPVCRVAPACMGTLILVYSIYVTPLLSDDQSGGREGKEDQTKI